MKLEIEGAVNCRDVLREVLITTGNRLALKIWFQLAAYDGDRLNRNSTDEEKNNHSNNVEIDAAWL